MRVLIIFALTAALAYGVWTLLGDDGESTQSPGEEYSNSVTPTTTRAPAPRTVTLALTVRTAASTIPPGTVAGYRWGGDDRVRPVDERGKVTFTDAPTGQVTLIARAPGYEELVQQRYLTGGVPTSAILILERRE
ncbi:MAG: hypothetical protein QNJ90_06510 [Planctomycetota bacterium]|nr:hypothetical protein [Planctomycetota bacterium]